MLLQMALFYSFLQLSGIPLYIHTSVLKKEEKKRNRAWRSGVPAPAQQVHVRALPLTNCSLGQVP